MKYHSIHEVWAKNTDDSLDALRIGEVFATPSLKTARFHEKMAQTSNLHHQKIVAGVDPKEKNIVDRKEKTQENPPLFNHGLSLIGSPRKLPLQTPPRNTHSKLPQKSMRNPFKNPPEIQNSIGIR